MCLDISSASQNMELTSFSIKQKRNVLTMAVAPGKGDKKGDGTKIQITVLPGAQPQKIPWLSPSNQCAEKKHYFSVKELDRLITAYKRVSKFN